MNMDSRKPTVIYNITLKPMRLLMYFSGAIPYEFEHELKGSKLLLIWRLIHMALIFSFIGILSFLRFLKYHEVLYKTTDIFSNGIDAISYSTLITIQIIIYLENTWKSYRYKEIFGNIEIIRNKLENELKNAINSARLRLYAILLYIVLALYMIIIVFMISIRYIKSLNGSRLIMIQYGDTIIKLKLIEFAILTTIVLSIQIDLKGFLVHYTNEVKKSKTLDWYDKRKLYEKIDVIKDIHNILIITVRSIEEYCFWSLPGLILKMFCEFTLTAYWIYFSYDNNTPSPFQSYGYCTTILNCLILFICSSICTKCENLDKQLSSMIHIIKHERYDPYFYASLNEISLQLYHQKLHFSAGGFINVNHAFLGKYIFSAVCYIVILIQFHMSV